MNITIETDLRTSLVFIEGRFDAHEVPGFTDQLDPLADAGVNQFRIDLSNVDFIDSAALARLVALSKSAAKAGGSLELLNPSPPTQIILELTGLDQALAIKFTDKSAQPHPQH